MCSYDLAIGSSGVKNIPLVALDVSKESLPVETFLMPFTPDKFQYPSSGSHSPYLVFA